MELGQYILIYLVGSLCLLLAFTRDNGRGFVQAEKFFLNNEQITSTENRSKRSAGIIRSTSQANAYLIRYGYLKCKPHSRKKESRMRNRYRQFNRPSSHHHHQQLLQPPGGLMTLNCDKQRVSQAIMQYQRTYHLPVTGQLDRGTKEFMSEFRCGNRDQSDGVVDEEFLQAQLVLLQQRIKPHQQSLQRSNRRFGRSVERRVNTEEDTGEEEEKDPRERAKLFDNKRYTTVSGTKTSTLNTLHGNRPHWSDVQDDSNPGEESISSTVSTDEILLAPFSSIRTTTRTFFDSLPQKWSSRLKEAFKRYSAKNGQNSVVINTDHDKSESSSYEGSISPEPFVKYAGTNELFDHNDSQSKRPKSAGRTNLYNNRHRYRSMSDSTKGLHSQNMATKATVSPPLSPLTSTTVNPQTDNVRAQVGEVGSKSDSVYNYFNNNEARLAVNPQTTLQSPLPWWPTPPQQNNPLLSSSSPLFVHHSPTHSRSPTPASSSHIKSTTQVSHTDSGASTDPIRSLDSDSSPKDGNYNSYNNHGETEDDGKNGFSSTSSSISSNIVPMNRATVKTTTTTTTLGMTRSSPGSEPIDHLTNKRIFNESLHNNANETALTGERKDRRLGSTTTTTTATTNESHIINNRKPRDRKWTQSQAVPIEGRSKERLYYPGRVDSRDIAYPSYPRMASVGSVYSDQPQTGREAGPHRCRQRRHHRRRCRRRHRHRHGRHRKKVPLKSNIPSPQPHPNPDSSSFNIFPSLPPPPSPQSSSSSSSSSASSSSKRRLKRSPPLPYPVTNRIQDRSRPESKPEPHDRGVVAARGRSRLSHPTNTKSFTRESPAYHLTPTPPPLPTSYSDTRTASPTPPTLSSSQLPPPFPSASSSSIPSPTLAPADQPRRPSQPLTINETPSLTLKASTINNTHPVKWSSANVLHVSRETSDWLDIGTQEDADDRVAQGAQTKSNVNDNADKNAQLGESESNGRNSRIEKENYSYNNNNKKLEDNTSFVQQRRNELLRRRPPSGVTTSLLESHEGESSTQRWWNKPRTESLLLSLLQYGMSPEERHHLQVRTDFLHRTIEQLKKNDPLWLRGVPAQERTKRSLVVNNMTAWGQMFKKKVVRWRLLSSGYSTRIPLEEQRATLTLAFRMWDEVIPLNFMEDLTSDVRDVDIHIAFGRGAHQNCKIDFDGAGGDVAHSWYTGNMHFDDDENFKAIYSPVSSGIYLLRVAVHEIGHVLGLNHTQKDYSVMYAIYHSRRLRREEFELGWEDRKDVQKIYGVCRGTFNTVFDWVRRRPNEQFIFNTYFFRGNRYWMYENHANRTRYGDPLNIGREWEGVPNDIDGYVHIWFFDSITGIVDVTYFFKGANYYLYDSLEDRVVDGWPHKISDGFGPKEGGKDRIPDNVDTIFFDMRDSNIYFFKDDKVYVYNPRGPGAPSTSGCCERIANIRDEYPSDDDHPLPDNLDAVYYSYKEKSMYFLKGEDVWRNVRFHRRQRNTVNMVQYEGKWYDHWYDICDVRNNILTPNGEIDIGT